MTEPRHSARCRSGRAILAGIAATALLLGACEGDTLYDTGLPDVTPPEVVVSDPESGTNVQAGQSVPIQVVAADARGVSQVTIRITGAAQETIVVQYAPPRDTVVLDTVFVIPPGTNGTIQIRATARNAAGGVAESTVVTLVASSTDNTPPTAALHIDAPERVELTDSLIARVVARDNPGGSGLRRVGVTAILVNVEQADTLVFTDEVEFAEPRTDQVESRFAIPSTFADSLALPQTLRWEFFGWAEDAVGLCAAAVEDDAARAVECATRVIRGTSYRVAAAAGASGESMVVSGRTVGIPGGGTIADLVVDTVRGKLYLSNVLRNSVHVMRPANRTWDANVLVGSEPWGLALNRTGDTLFVANSGGTTISSVSLAGTPREDLSARYFTKNAPLFEIQRELVIDSIENVSVVRYTGRFIDFSDRPQFIAQDAAGRLLYSTKPTGAAPDGTVRVARRLAGWQAPDARILLGFDDIEFTKDVFAIAHVDSVKLYTRTGGDDLVEVFDHTPGFPNQVISSGLRPIKEALAFLEDSTASDVLWAEGAWRIDDIGLADTTYVAASGDRRFVAFGEGGTAARAGRILMWSSDRADIHNEILVADLVGNASERIHGVDLNRDGSFGSARGSVSAYYFMNDLRKIGRFSDGITVEGTGAQLHADHPVYGQGTASSTRTLSFVGTGTRSVRIVDTVHFTERGHIQIRDRVVGPLRAGPPLPSDNAGQGRNCNGSHCVVMKLYGVTEADGVVVIDVRAGDIRPNP